MKIVSTLLEDFQGWIMVHGWRHRTLTLPVSIHGGPFA
jgi:hypothetical protein